MLGAMVDQHCDIGYYRVQKIQVNIEPINVYNNIINDK